MKSAFRLIDDEMIVEETKGVGDAKEIAAKYAQEYGDKCVIVSCGGDGTVHEIANGLAHTDTPMLILPLGTGNDFAKKIYGTKKINVENVIKAFGFYNGKIKYDVKPIDLIDYNGEKCINVMSFGLDTIVETIGRKIAGKVPALGHQAYNIATIPVLMKPLHYKISFDLNCYNKETGEDYQMRVENKDYALFAICNASYYGGGFCPAPDSVLDDGLLDFALVDGLSLAQALPLVPKYSKGTANEQTCGKVFHNGYVKSGRFWMEDGSPLLGNCDGENFDYSQLDFKVENKSLKLCFIKG
jgi:diacylglycerol kinase family enzyme